MKTSRVSSKSSTVRSLRTGKIHTAKSSASEIRRTLGVTPSEAKVASNALRVARSAVAGRFVAPKGKIVSKPRVGGKSKKH
jgi:hypothetical protein